MFLFVSNFNLADGFGEFQTGVAPPVVIVFVKKLNNSEDKKSRPTSSESEPPWDLC